jgi:hypothetical protein
MLNIGQLVNVVQDNCHISDARHAGSYSMCSFLLKMREYYRWENDIPLTCKLPQADVGNWLNAREQTWEALQDSDYRSLPLAQGEIDPFENDAINQELVPQGYVYSSGYGVFSKPHFFLGKLHSHETRDGVDIYISSCEYARDLVAPPAMLRENAIFIRQESIRRFVWEKIEEWQWRRQPDHSPMARVFKDFDDSDDLDAILDRLTREETEIMILHERGEVEAGRILGGEWENMLSSLAGTQAEFIARAMRDHLADALTTLPWLLQHPQSRSLHFYFVNFTGLRKALYPSLHAAYQRWLETDDISALAEQVTQGAQRWEGEAANLLDLHRAHNAKLAGTIEAAYQERLGK